MRINEPAKEKHLPTAQLLGVAAVALAVYVLSSGPVLSSTKMNLIACRFYSPLFRTAPDAARRYAQAWGVDPIQMFFMPSTWYPRKNVYHHPKHTVWADKPRSDSE